MKTRGWLPLGGVSEGWLDGSAGGVSRRLTRTWEASGIRRVTAEPAKLASVRGVEIV